MPRQRNSSPIILAAALVAILFAGAVAVFMFLPEEPATPPVEEVAQPVVEEPLPEEPTVEPAPDAPDAPEVAAVAPTPTPSPAPPAPTATPRPEPVEELIPAEPEPEPEPEPVETAEEPTLYPDWLSEPAEDSLDAFPAADPDVEEPEVAEEALEEPPAPLDTVADAEDTTPVVISATVDSDDPVHVSGTIRDHLGNPVSDGAVFVIASTDGTLQEKVRRAFASSHTHTIVKTNDAGAFQFHIPPRKIFLAGLMIAGEPQPVVREVGPELPGAEIAIEFEKPRPFTLRGAVTNRAGQRLGDIPVQLRWTPTTLRGRTAEESTLRLRSDGEGYFQTEIPDVARVVLQVEAERLPPPFIHDEEPRIIRREDFQSNRYHRTTIELLTGVDLEGRVVSGETPVPGTRITVTPVGEQGLMEEKARITQADNDGRFRFETLHPRRYLVAATMDGYDPFYLRDFLPVTGEPVTMDLRPFAEVEGRFSVGDGGHDGGAAQVHLLGRRGGSHSKSVEVEPGEEGRWSFDRLTSGSYLLTIAFEDAGGGEWYAEAPLAIVDGTVRDKPNLALRPIHSAEGHFSSSPPAGADYPDLKVTLVPSDRDPNPLFPATFQKEFRRLPRADIDTDGRFTLVDLQAGETYRLEVRTPGGTNPIGGAVVYPGAKSSDLAVSLSGTGRIKGLVKNERAESCAGTRVILTTGLGTMEGAIGTIQRRTAEVRYDGTYSFDAVPTGNARITVEGEDRAARLIYIPSNETVEMNLECRTWVAVNFDVRDASGQGIGAQEHFLVIAQPGTVVRDQVRELTAEKLETLLEPGRYVITRTATMESRSFEVQPRLPGTIPIEFGRSN